MGDLSLAVQLEHSCSLRDTTCGTLWYIAPEVYDGCTVLKTDVWALGISLIEMAEGKNPFDGCTSAIVRKRVMKEEPPTLSSSKWSAEFVDFVSKCLVKDAANRHSVSELMNVSGGEEE